MRVVHQGIPYNVPDEKVQGYTREQVRQIVDYQIEQDPTVRERRARELGLSDYDVESLSKQAAGEGTLIRAETGGLFDRLMIGAGRASTQIMRGVEQIYASARGESSNLEQLKKEEALERETFAALDDEGIGMEDLGQMLPETLAFLGGGGLISIGLRGAGLGATQATATGQDEVSTRGINALISGALSVAGPGAAKAAAGVFHRATRLTSGVTNALLGVMGRIQGTPTQAIGTIAYQSAKAESATSAAMQQLGRVARQRAMVIVRNLNSAGKKDVVAQAADAALTEATKVVDGVPVLDPGAFAVGLQNFGRSQMVQELGTQAGRQLDLVRNTFEQLAEITVLSQPQARALLRGITSDKRAATLAREMARAKSKDVREALWRSLQQSLAQTTENVGQAAGVEATRAAPETALEGYRNFGGAQN